MYMSHLWESQRSEEGVVSTVAGDRGSYDSPDEVLGPVN